MTINMSSLITYSFHLLLVLVCSCAKTEFSVTLDSQDKFNISWSYDGTGKDDYVTFEVRLMEFDSHVEQFHIE